MKICIFLSYFEGSLDTAKNWTNNLNFDLIIACDGGASLCRKLNYKPNIIIGDFDSLDDAPSNDNYPDAEIIQLSKDKDFSDFEAALRLINHRFAKKGNIDLTVIGGLGGRLDHSLGNIQSLVNSVPLYESTSILDGKNKMIILKPGQYKYMVQKGSHFGLIALTDTVSNLSLSGSKYVLKNGILTDRKPFAISNMTKDRPLDISFDTGLLAVIFTRV